MLNTGLRRVLSHIIILSQILYSKLSPRRQETERGGGAEEKEKGRDGMPRWMKEHGVKFLSHLERVAHSS